MGLYRFGAQLANVHRAESCHNNLSSVAPQLGLAVASELGLWDGAESAAPGANHGSLVRELLIRPRRTIALAGMIMRNSVILIDQIQQDIDAGHDRWHAIIDATVRRFRPIVLTALAAVLAMIPLSRSAFYGSMAISIMGGLIVGTVLTLVFLPALYAAWFRVKPDEAR